MSRSSLSKAFFRTFPPPAYINMPYAGIDISDTAIHCLEFKKGSRKDSLQIGKYLVRPLAPGIVDEGYVKDEPALTAAVAEVVKKLGITRVRASLPEEKVYLFRTEIPSLNVQEIAQNIESKLEENVPLSPADAIFHFKIIPGDASVSGRLSASVTAVPVKVVETYLRVLKNAGVAVSAFEMQARAVSHGIIPHDSQETIMIVYGVNATDEKNKKAGIYIVYRKVVCFTVTIPIESDLTRDIGKGIKEVAEYWLERGEGNMAGQPAQGKNTVSRILVCGSDAFRAAVETASADLKVPVAPANVWQNAFTTEKYTPPITAADSMEYAVAAGLALPYVHYSTGDTRF